MSYNAKNYTEQGGEKTVIGGTLEVADGATVTGIAAASIVDNVTSTDTDKALSANQGKVLKTLVDAKVATAAIVNDVTTGGVAVPLSAEQGKSLKALVDATVTTASIVNDLTTGGVAVPLSAEQGKTLAGRVAANQADSVEDTNPTVEEFNTLLAKLKTAGLMAADA